MKNGYEQHQESTNKKLKSNLALPICENKKTRDLPNLSECQTCGFRTDACSGKNRIQILYSEWRIVLLCNRCLSRVESSLICSYCFNETTNDSFSCSQCKRCVHRTCFLKYRTVSPWSYSSSSSMDFSVCVDCWVPESMIKRRGFFIGRNYSSHSKVFNDAQSLKDPNFALERTVVLALMAPPMAAKKLMEVAKMPMEMESNALNLEVKREGDDCNDKKVVDDAELAFKLHRAMNSSRRISKNLCAVKSSSSSVPKIQEFNDNLVLRCSDSGNPSVSCEIEVCANKKMNENLDRNVLDPLLCVKDEDIGVQLKEGEGSCSNKLVKSSGDENSTNFESRSCHNNQYESTECKVETCDGKPDRYLLKYRKRNPSSKRVPNGRPKILYERIPNQNQPPDAGLSLNCSRESRTFSNGSFQSCAFPLQASTCASGLSPDQS
ncbi:uncharacterized protein LOC116141330 [Pistacia vera]|uniref:uncharacterized protein LOC116141330 n=1 Tax=Pistacia vera TaxID=55513 RepID=UPI001262FF44|nr:uncharacterized protein LOC116141330 [Pistacia vera]